MTFLAYRLVRPYPRYSSIVCYTGMVISLRPVILVSSKVVAVRIQYERILTELCCRLLFLCVRPIEK